MATKQNQPKIVFYSPYIPNHFGGGELYVWRCASLLADSNQVFVAISRPQMERFLQDYQPDLLDKLEEWFSKQDPNHQISKLISIKYQEYFNLPEISKVKIIPTPLGSPNSSVARLIWTKQWDTIYFASDGSIFPSLAGHNILHLQIPFSDKKSLFDRIKLKNWQVKNANSEFTKSIIEKNWKTKIDFVHYPTFVKTAPLTSLKNKSKIILNVGRFFTQLHAKRQDVLVKIWRKLIVQHPKISKGWKLVLVGNVEDKKYAEEIKQLAKGWPIEIHHQIDRKQLEKLFKQASIYWHATGYDIDQETNPEKVEHFGITTLEAMAAGCAPVVHNKGGQPEVLGSQLENLGWQTQAEAIKITSELMNQPKKLLSAQKKAIHRASYFSKEKFQNILNQMIKPS